MAIHSESTLHTPPPSTHTWLLYQLADSALPTGGFIASAGLEAATTSGIVKQNDLDSLSRFLASSIHTYAHSTTPYVERAWSIVNRGIGGEQSELHDELSVDAAGERRHSNGAQSQSPNGTTTSQEFDPVEELVRLDRLYEACTSSAVARRASSAQGGAMLMLFSKSFADVDTGDRTRTSAPTRRKLTDIVDAFKLAVRRDESPGHLPVCFGIIARCLDLELANATHLNLFLHTRTLLSSAVRLNLVGPYLAQRVLASLEGTAQKALEGALREARTRDLYVDGAVGCTCPAIEIVQGLHERLYSRLFNS